MPLDAKTLRDFYRTPLGRVVRRQLATAIRERWKRVNGMTVAGVGFASPFLGAFHTEAASLACLMPARQGAIVWPRSGHCHSVLVAENQWPLPDNSVDRLLAVHCLEQAEREGPFLREVWRVLKPDGRLLIIEMVLPAGDTPHMGKVLDMVMLVFPGGQERTEAEYASLLGKASFRLSRVVPTASAVSVVEAVPA